MKLAPVSAIIPCYNCQNTIERAVISVAEQTYRPSELILVDDASSDRTLQKLNELESKFELGWIKLVKDKQNRGPAAARNLGWDMAVEKYIAFLDADDAWHSRKIELQYAWMRQNPNAVLTGHRCVWKRTDAISLPAVTDTFRIIKVSPLRLLISNRFLTRSVMMRKDLPYRFNTHKRHSEDYLLWLQIVFNHYEACYMDIVLAYSFKAPIGESGLSGNIWAMEKGELDTFRRLYREGFISYGVFLCLIHYSLTKHMIRFIRCKTKPMHAFSTLAKMNIACW